MTCALDTIRPRAVAVLAFVRFRTFWGSPRREKIPASCCLVCRRKAHRLRSNERNVDGSSVGQDSCFPLRQGKSGNYGIISSVIYPAPLRSLREVCCLSAARGLRCVLNNDRDWLGGGARHARRRAVFLRDVGIRARWCARLGARGAAAGKCPIMLRRRRGCADAAADRLTFGILSRTDVRERRGRCRGRVEPSLSNLWRRAARGRKSRLVRPAGV